MEVRRRPWGLVVVAFAVAGLCAWLALRHRGHTASPVTPSVTVAAATVRRTDMPVVIEAIGAAQAWQSDTIHAQVNGRLLRVAVRKARRSRRRADRADRSGAVPGRAAAVTGSAPAGSGAALACAA